MVLVTAMVVGAAGCASGTDSTRSVSRSTDGSTSVVQTIEPAALSTDAPPDRRGWIVYQSVTGLHRVLPDATGDQPAAGKLSASALHPDFSRDGQRLAFNTDEPDGTRDVWTASWDGADAARLVDCQAPCRDADGPAWSPDGKRIAFTRIDSIDGHNPGSALQLVDVASGNIRTVLSTQGAEYLGGPRWSPDGNSLVVEITRFADDGNDTTEITGRAIAVVDLTANQAKLDIIRPLDSFASYPDWHPTESLIVFAEGGRDPLNPAEPPQNLFTVRPDGAGLAQLTRQGTEDDGLWMPAFRFGDAQLLATRVHRPGGHLTLVSIQPDGTVTDLGKGDGLLGAHSRERPVPSGR